MAYFASALAFLALLLWSRITAADPQTNLLLRACSLINVTNTTAFAATINLTFSDLRFTISSAAPGSSATHFATAWGYAQPFYALFQCRGYLSTADCLTCFSAAEVCIRICGPANGARVIYDGCFLRYESTPFFQSKGPGNGNNCGERNSTSGFSASVRPLLEDLKANTPRTREFFAAVEREGVFAVAQCVETVSEEGCEQCLATAVDHVMLCLPSADGRAVDAGCFMRYSDESFFPANRTVDLSPYLTNSARNVTMEHGRAKSSKKGALIGAVAGGVGGLLLLLGAISLLWIRRSRDQRNPSEGDTLGESTLQGSVNFHYKDLKTATNNFSEKNKVGKGGFGDVYKGQLKNGRTVAVKRLIITQTSRARADFQSEVKLIRNIHHRNLVNLLGYSSKCDNFLLVYEYMTNGSLDKFIFGNRRGFLNWRQRFDIIVGVARGLAYLHQEFLVRIIHRDIKCSNILLDNNFQPRVADFGLARLLPEDKSHVNTIFAGTFGYTAPEYAIHGQLSEKVDTYSYGIVVLEIISGRKCNDIKLQPVTQYLLEWAWKLYERDLLLEMVDETLDASDYTPEEVKRIIKIALLCTQSTVAARPTMSEIVVLLVNQTDDALHPTRPTFIEASNRVYGEASSSPAGSTSTPVAASHATFSTFQFSAR
ncbi:cysteine-rich receptor-like protein kinase 2 isoform X1 [Zingiber officinale]|uniref:cysteine-rich receptor-like protein kinase 2 isoform X1 n=1 Tax=Zingiber officinale TaxID=94328 RepID=UPI001C4BB92C|nr:cysteine-rich receptor-like protein kinase 2 isoform X1 [Zingiber officinale]